MRPHIEAHMSGQLLGDVPSDWLRSQGFGTCEVCQRILSLRFNGRCPSCFHVLASSRGRPSADSRPLAEGGPTIWDVFTSGWCTRRLVSLPRYRSLRRYRSQTSSFMDRPPYTAGAGSCRTVQGGRRHALRLDNDTRRRCLDWVNGIRGDLWAPDTGRRGGVSQGPRHGQFR